MQKNVYLCKRHRRRQRLSGKIQLLFTSKKQNVMKKFFLAFVAIVCMALTCVTFSACSSNSDESGQIVSYIATGSISTSGSDAAEFGAMKIIAEYTTAIKGVHPDYSTTAHDDAVIAACDKTFESQKTKYPTASGTVTVKKYVGSDNNGTVLKVYTFGN